MSPNGGMRVLLKRVVRTMRACDILGRTDVRSFQRSLSERGSDRICTASWTNGPITPTSGAGVVCGEGNASLRVWWATFKSVRYRLNSDATLMEAVATCKLTDADKYSDSRERCTRSVFYIDNSLPYVNGRQVPSQHTAERHLLLPESSESLAEDSSRKSGASTAMRGVCGRLSVTICRTHTR